MILGKQIEIADSFELAKELSLRLSLSNIPPDQSMLQETTNILNHSLIGAHDNVPSVVKAAVAYVIPSDETELEFMAEEHVYESKVENPIMKGLAYEFEWIGSLMLSGFGLRMFDVQFLRPTRKRVETLFVPVEVIDFRLPVAR